MLSIIAAVSKNWVIGKDGKLPWRLPEDLKRFKELTTGHPIIMGRKTYESIGRPLPYRRNIVITRDMNYEAPECLVVHSVEEALDAANPVNEVFCIGGEEIYKEFLPLADKIYLTKINKDFDGDAFFPVVDWSEWEEVERKIGIDCEFLTFKRKE